MQRAAAPAAAPDLVDQVVPNARNAQAQQQQAAAAAAALGADRLELQAGARLEDSLPFVVLLLLVFLQQHISGSAPSLAVDRAAQRQRADPHAGAPQGAARLNAVLSLASLLFSQMCMVVMLCGASSSAPSSRSAPSTTAPAPRLRASLAVAATSWCATWMLLKVVLTLVCPAAAFRRLRRVFSLLERGAPSTLAAADAEVVRGAPIRPGPALRVAADWAVPHVRCSPRSSSVCARRWRWGARCCSTSLRLGSTPRRTVLEAGDEPHRQEHMSRRPRRRLPSLLRGMHPRVV